MLIRKLHTFINDPWTLVLKVLKVTGNILSDRQYLSIYYYAINRHLLHINKPVLFTEKLQWLKLYNRKTEYTNMVDKLKVKEYVRQMIGENHVIPTIDIYNSINDIDINKLPEQFVLKTTYGGGSSGVIVCEDKNTLNWELAKKKLYRGTKHDIYKTLKEWPYKNVERKIFAEKYIKHAGDLSDYKFFCFNGRVEYCQVISDRRDNECIDFYDRNWNHQEFTGLTVFKNSDKIQPIPQNYEQMISIAEKLSINIPFVRVDLYNVNGKIYFGEITFFPASGFGKFDPPEWNRKLGELIVIPTNRYV